MYIALIADAFPPLRSSGAVQLRDLSSELLRQGHVPTVIIPTSELKQAWILEDFNGVQVLRLKAPKTKDIGYIRRTIAEFLMPFAMLHNFKKTPLAKQKWDGVVWYSPTIFLGPLVHALKTASHCKSYLILRDIFPEWAVDMGLLSRGLPYRFFKAVEKYQYSVADVIGVQTPGNVAYFDAWVKQSHRRVEVLQNWLADATNIGCCISVANSAIAGRTIFVYAGNMGVAQGMGILLELAERLLVRQDIGFLFVGRGSDAQLLKSQAETRQLKNVVFFDEIDPTEIPGLYKQCHFGIVALDPRHKTHNVPGKFLTYMQSGLPVLANINAGNDLTGIIRQEDVGRVSEDGKVGTLGRLAIELVDSLNTNEDIKNRCRNLYSKLFSPENAVTQIVAALSNSEVGT